MSGGERYLLDNQQAQAGIRFDALSSLFDPATFRHIENLGITAGWRCWEVGSGGPTVPSWLARQVGPTGRVLATDIDTAWMSGADGFPRCVATTWAPTRHPRRHSTSCTPASSWSTSLNATTPFR